MSNQNELCFLHFDGWTEWWEDIKQGTIEMYISVVLFFLSAALGQPMARCIFFLLRKITPKTWIWPDEAKNRMMWQTALLCRISLLWVALIVSRLSLFLCQWPYWIFGGAFIIWMDALCNLARTVFERRGVEGYSEEEKNGRRTLLREGANVAKFLWLMILVYSFYIGTLIGDNQSIRMVFFMGFFFSIGLSMLPIMKNIIAAHYLFLGNMLSGNVSVRVDQTIKGNISEGPLGFIVLNTGLESLSKQELTEEEQEKEKEKEEQEKEKEKKTPVGIIVPDDQIFSENSTSTCDHYYSIEKDDHRTCSTKKTKLICQLQRTFVPASLALSQTTCVFQDHFWPFKLFIRLPSTLKSLQVRRIIQKIDRNYIAHTTFALSSKLFFMENPSSGSNSSFDDDGGGGGSGGGFDSVESDGKSLFTQEITNLQTMLLQNTTTRLLAYSHTKRFYRSEEEEILERARVKQSFVALETTEKWILRVQLYIPPMHRHNDFVKIRAIYIEEITRLIEKEIKEADFIHYHTQCV